jgi:hypothetical protein
MNTLKQAAQQALEALEGVYLSLQLPDLLKVIGPITALREALAQPEQKPVAWMVKLGDVTCFQHHADSKHASVPLYTTPPASQRPWQGLTDEDVNRESAMIASKMKLAFHSGMYVAQKILKERNT